MAGLPAGLSDDDDDEDDRGSPFGSFGFGRRSPFGSPNGAFFGGGIEEVPEDDGGSMLDANVSFCTESAYTAATASKQQKFQDRDWARIQSSIEMGIDLNDNTTGIVSNASGDEELDSDVEIVFGANDERLRSDRDEGAIGGNSGPGFAALLPAGPTKRERAFLKAMKQQVKLGNSKILKLKESRKQQRQESIKLRMEVEELRNKLVEMEIAHKAEGRSKGFDLRGLPSAGSAAALKAEEDRRKREEQRRQLKEGLVDLVADDDDFGLMGLGLGGLTEGFVGQLISKLMKLKRKTRRFMRKHTPLQADVRMIGARYGYSVASYFIFSRWVMFNFTMAVLCYSYLVARHIWALATEKQMKFVQGRFNVGSHMNGTGYTTKSAVDNEGTLASFSSWSLFSTFGDDEALGYAGVQLAVIFVVLYMTVRKWVIEDRNSKMVGMFEESQKSTRYSKVALNAWNFSVYKTQEVEDNRFGIGELLTTMLHDDKSGDTKEGRTTREKRILLARRAIAGLFLLAFLAAGWAAILFLTAFSTEVEENIANAIGTVPISIVPLAASIINALLPTTIKVVVGICRFDDVGFSTKLQLGLLFFAKMFNVYIQLLSLMLLGNPYMLKAMTLFDDKVNVRGVFQKPYSKEKYACRADQVGDNLFTLVTTEFMVGKVIAVVGALVAMLIAKVRKKPWQKKEFQVAQSTINLLYFQMLAFMPALFMPFAPVLCLLLMLANFKWDAFYLKRFLAKPKKPWAAKDAGVFYVKFYFFVVINVLFCNIVVLSERTMPKECGIQGLHVPEATVTFLNNLKESDPDYASGMDADRYKYDTCRDACGPFAFYESANTPVVDAIAAIPVLGTLQNLSTETSTFPWFVAFLLWVRVKFRNNSLGVVRHTFFLATPNTFIFRFAKFLAIA